MKWEWYFQIFFTEYFGFAIQISPKFVPGVLIVKPVLAQIMAWSHTSNKPLSEPMMVSFTEAYLSHSASMS